jgi:hypothetical protein
MNCDPNVAGRDSDDAGIAFVEVYLAKPGVSGIENAVSDFGRVVSDSASHSWLIPSLDEAKALTLKWIAVVLVWLRSCS